MRIRAFYSDGRVFEGEAEVKDWVFAGMKIIESTELPMGIVERVEEVTLEKMLSYDWEAHWSALAEEVASQSEWDPALIGKVVALALVLHSVFDGRAWGTGELSCWCGTFDDHDEETLHPDPSTNCWRLAAAIILEGGS